MDGIWSFKFQMTQISDDSKHEGTRVDSGKVRRALDIRTFGIGR